MIMTETAATPANGRDESPDAHFAPEDVARLNQNFFPELGAESVLSSVPLVRGVLFDFDYTLAYSTRPFDELWEEGARNAEAYMRSQNMDLPADFWRNIIEARRFAQEKSEEEQEEHIADDAMSFLLQFFGYPASKLDPVVLRNAVDIFYAPEMSAWALYPGAHETLAALRREGYRLGIVANYACDRVFQRTIDFLALRPYLDICLTSAGVEYRKPDTAFFDIVLQQWDALPYEIVVVGDSLRHDIAGAIELGALAVQAMFGSEAQTEFDNRQASATIAPDAVIASLSQLPEIIAHWAEA